VHLVTATVVRLVRTLAHGYFSEGFEGCPLHTASVLVVQPAPPVRAAARWRIVDMRHPSTGSDRPTVRGGRSGGQTHEPPLLVCLWMTLAPCLHRRLRSGPPRSVPTTVRPGSSTLCDPGHRPLEPVSDLRKRWKDHQPLRPWGSDPTDQARQFTACGQLCGSLTGHIGGVVPPRPDPEQHTSTTTW
jgi:hypothetical protein